MMKVTFCAYDNFNYVGGPNVWLKRLLPDLRKRGIESRILFITHGSPPENCPTINALRVQGFDCPAVIWPRYTEQRMRWIIKRLVEDPPDIFVPNLMVPAYYAGRWVREANIPTVGILHSDDVFYYGLLDEFVLGNPKYRLSALVCVSKFLEEKVLSLCPPQTLVRRIPCGVPIPHPKASIPKDRFRLVYTGRLVEEQKRAPEVALALCRAVRKIPNTEALIFGDGPARAVVERVLLEEGKGLPVYLAGRINSEKIQEHLLNCHAFILLSDYEGLPISLMEAMACGIVPICLRVRSGVPELVEDGISGLLVRDRGEDFISAVRRLRTDPDLWERMSRAARLKIEAEYSIKICASRWEMLLQELYRSAGQKKPPTLPRRLSLPPVHPGLAREDNRRPPIFVLLTTKARRVRAKVRDWVFKKSVGSVPKENKARFNPPLLSDRFYHLQLLKKSMESIAENYLQKKGRCVLIDFGCGTKPYQPLFEKYALEYIAVDLPGNKRADFYADINGKTQLPDSLADVVLSTQVLEYVAQPRKYLQECHRLLKPGGLLILSTHGYWKYHPDPYDLWRWTGEGLRRLLKEARFQILELRGLMGLASTAIHLLQDALILRVPRFLRPGFSFFMQRLAIIADKLHLPSERERDACTYVIVAQKVVKLETKEVGSKEASFSFPLRGRGKKAKFETHKRYTVCIVSPNRDVYSETFIRAHIEQLPIRTRVLYGGSFPMYKDEGTRLLSLPLFALFRSRKFLPKLMATIVGRFPEQALKRFLQASKVDVVLAEYGPTGVAIMDACQQANRPLVVHFHGFDAFHYPTLEKFETGYREMFKVAAALVVVSRDMEAQLLKLGAPKEKVFYNPYGVDTALFTGGAPASAAPLFIAVGRFVDKKAPHLTLLAFEKVLKVCPEAQMLMIGDGELWEACKQLVRALGIRDAVQFLGPRPHREVAYMMRKARAFVQHSLVTSYGDSEGTPVAILEAGATGLPVVSTFHGGIKEIVTHGKTGFLVKERDIEAMANYMIELAKKPKLAASLGKQAQEYIRTYFSMEKSIEGLQKILESVLHQ